MYIALFLRASSVCGSGKPASQRLEATSPPGFSTHSHLFFVTDRVIGTRFLVDTGADVSVLPQSRSEQRQSSPFTLQAVNQSPISSYGEKSMTLDLGLRRSFRWIFILAEIPMPILGADFLAHFSIQVDVRNRLLIDTTTSLCVQALLSVGNTQP